MKSQKIISLNPSKNYEPIGEIYSSTHDEVDAKVTSARKAQPAWSHLTVGERITLLERCSQEFIARKNDIRSIIAQEIGMPISVCNQIDIDLGLRYMRGYKHSLELSLFYFYLGNNAKFDCRKYRCC